MRKLVPWSQRMTLLGICVLGLSRIAAAETLDQRKGDAAMVDPHSRANLNQVRQTHLDLKIAIDFQRRVISGTARLTIENDADATQLILDTRSMDIDRVELIDDRGQFEDGEFEVSPADPKLPHLGQALTIPIRATTTGVKIHYQTRPDAAALQWLAADQTADGRGPFLYTQSQAILARTWVPCQDSPAVRMTYTAEVQVPSGMLAVMSATNPTKPEESGLYRFTMEQPIPSYLLALAVGHLSCQAIGSRCSVYAEPSVVEAAAYEFAETERMIAAAEKLYGPYRWERFDILVLPPSFPFGGMENPRLTFATPTILAGDRSLVSLIAHELAHSWSGNLVTNATWDDFWLNEGFTVYFEHRIMEAMFGREYDEVLALLGKRGLQNEMKLLADRDTWLKLDLAGRDPDDGMTDVAYEKGYLFLRTIEELVGRDKFDPFLRTYFDQFAFRSVTTEQFLDYLRETLLRDHDGPNLNIENWVYGPGLPQNCPEITTTSLTEVEALAADFADRGESDRLVGKVEDWSTHLWLHFLRSLPQPLSIDKLEVLDREFELTNSSNKEILHDWLLHSVASDYSPASDALERFLTTQGRRKFLGPLYRALSQTPDGFERAKRIYAQARAGYHAISRATVDEILGWQVTTP